MAEFPAMPLWTDATEDDLWEIFVECVKREEKDRERIAKRVYRYCAGLPLSRQSLPPKVRSMVYDRDRGICADCGEYLEYERFTVDHIIPVSKGGGDDLHNLQVMCRPCNSSKGAR